MIPRQKSLSVLIVGLCLQCTLLAETVGIFSDTTIGQIKFAAGDIKTALESKGFTVEMFKDISMAQNADCTISFDPFR